MNKNVSQARRAAGLSLRSLAELVGVSAMALSKYERGLIQPSEAVTKRLCIALGVSREFLAGESTAELSAVEYRAAARMTPFSKKRIHDEIRAKIDTRLTIETVLPELHPPPLALPRRSRSITTMDAIESIANDMRSHWALSDQPIRNLTNALEANGLRTFTATTPDAHFDGLSARFGDDPIVVTGSDWPGDRQRFTLSHELGHFVLHDRLAAGIDEEHACHRFAGAFIAPADPFRGSVGPSPITPFDLYTLKQDWGLSMGACLYRCADLDLVSTREAKSLWRAFRQNGWMTQEPGEQMPRELPTRLLRRVYAAWCDGRLDTDLASAFLADAADELAAVLDKDVDD